LSVSYTWTPEPSPEEILGLLDAGLSREYVSQKNVTPRNGLKGGGRRGLRWESFGKENLTKETGDGLDKNEIASYSMALD
jgi:hypothetical protein